jgi:hypothetical protein
VEPADWRIQNGSMGDWWLPAFGAVYVGLIVMRIVAGRQLHAGNGRLALFLIGPSVLLLLFSLVLIVFSISNLGLLAIPLAGFVALVAFLQLRGLVAVARAGLSGDVDRVSDAVFGEGAEAMLASMAVIVVFAIVAGLAFVVYVVVNGGLG